MILESSRLSDNRGQGYFPTFVVNSLPPQSNSAPLWVTPLPPRMSLTKLLLKFGPREFEKSLQDWNYENRLLLYRGKIYIPHSIEDTLRQQIIQMYHNFPSARHPGRWKTYKLVSRNYWWPGMTTFVKKYVTGCDMC